MDFVEASRSDQVSYPQRCPRWGRCSVALVGVAVLARDRGRRSPLGAADLESGLGGPARDRGRRGATLTGSTESLRRGL